MADAIVAVTEDYRWACNYLKERIDTLHLADPTVEGTLLEHAANLPAGEIAGLEETATRRIANRIESGKLEEARAELAKAAGSLPLFERERLFDRVADRLMQKGKFQDAAEVMVGFAWTACTEGDLVRATSAIERAYGLWARGDGDSLPDWIGRAAANIRSAWEDSEELVDWRRSEEERRREVLRGHLINTQILVAGGVRKEHSLERLRDMTGAKVEWAESFRGDGDSLGRFADRIRNGKYALVIYLFQKSGHEVQDQIKSACVSADIPFLYAAGAGADGLLDGVWREFAGDGN